MLRLADEISRHKFGVGARIGNNQNLGRASLTIDADESRHGALRRSHEHVARAGYHVNRLEADRGHTVGERGNRACSADRVQLFYTDECGSPQHHLVRPPAIVALCRRGERKTLHSGRLRGNSVHEYR